LIKFAEFDPALVVVEEVVDMPAGIQVADMFTRGIGEGRQGTARQFWSDCPVLYLLRSHNRPGAAQIGVGVPLLIVSRVTQCDRVAQADPRAADYGGLADSRVSRCRPDRLLVCGVRGGMGDV
jgi:hypothetical protein